MKAVWLTSQDLDRMAVPSEELGKAVLLCQKFEATCKDIVSWFEIVRKLDEEKIEFLGDEYLSYVDKLHQFLLGESILTLRRNHGRIGISADELSILNQARISRNWIVHRSGLEAVFANGEIDNEQLVFHIRKIARGDFLVSSWSYEFHEKDTCNWKVEQEYIEMIVRWVQLI
ncbi:hypothetical protein LLE49_08040 [Alicyclobacillus tolerans]|uniref:hypothetical protein n=1 Tax=Alicyclobacillus tolerans TaxID=90970 RepID=UPI001F3B95CF|nr:hypothetical protein [Alicyclobacillus tolerans]MCF8564696.1 hypothetical protein [Alicyclobacillus tolerans]